MKGLLTVLAVVGAAETAEAAFAPALLLGNPAVQQEYIDALKALQEERFGDAESRVGPALPDATRIERRT